MSRGLLVDKNEKNKKTLPSVMDGRCKGESSLLLTLHVRRHRCDSHRLNTVRKVEEDHVTVL